jgi:MFS family permease
VNDIDLHPLFYQLNKRQKITVEILVFFSTITVAIGQTIVFTVLQPVGRELGLEPIHVGLIIVGSSIIFATGNNIWGVQSERWGRKAIILLGLVGYTCGTILFTSVFYLGFEKILVGTWLIICLTLARMLQSTLMSATPPAASAYIADITDVNTRTAAMARVGSAHSLGTILGPASAGLLAGFALLAPLYFAAILPFIAAICCWIGLPKTQATSRLNFKASKISYFDKRIRRFVFIGISMFTAFAAMNMTLGFYVQDLMQLNATDTIKYMGKLAMFSALASVSSQWILANWLKWPSLWLIRLGIPLITIGAINIIFANAFFDFALSNVLIGFGMGIVGPGYSAAASLQVSSKEQGAVAGLITSCAPIGFSIGPIIGPGLYQINQHLPYIFTSIIMCFLSIYCLSLLKIRKTT